MGAARYDFEIEQGARLLLPMTYKDSAGAAINITGYTGKLQIREKPESTASLLDCTTANGRFAITNAAAGQFKIDVAGTDTAALSFATAKYDLFIYDASSNAKRILYGTVTLVRTVTR